MTERDDEVVRARKKSERLQRLAAEENRLVSTRCDAQRKLNVLDSVGSHQNIATVYVSTSPWDKNNPTKMSFKIMDIGGRDNGYMSKLTEGMEMIHFGAKKCLQSEIRRLGSELEEVRRELKEIVNDTE